MNWIIVSWKELHSLWLLYTSVVLTEKYNIMVNSAQLISTTEHLMLQTRFLTNQCQHNQVWLYRSADKSLARPTSQCILFDGENILFDASLVIYTNSTNIPAIRIINRIHENQNLLSL
jgi:hypothetical protein